MNRRPKKSRRVTVDGNTWLWRCSRNGTVTLWAPDGTKTYVRSPANGASHDTFERGQHKRTSDGAITPLHVVSAVRALQKQPRAEDQSRNGVRVIVYHWPGGGRTVDADCDCFGYRGRVHTNPRCPRIPR